MTTEKYLKWLLGRTGNQVTSTELLDLVNIAQNEIFSYNTYFNQVKPTNSLFLNTTAGILQYTIADSDIRQVSRFYYGSYTNNDLGYLGDRVYAPRQHVPVQVTESLDVDDNVTVFFDTDPGDTTEQYYYDAYTWPTNGQLTSTTVKLSVPEKVQTGLLYYMVAVLLELDKDGRSISFLDLKEEAFRDYFTFANQGAKIQTNVPIPNEE